MGRAAAARPIRHDQKARASDCGRRRAPAKKSADCCRDNRRAARRRSRSSRIYRLSSRENSTADPLYHRPQVDRATAAAPAPMSTLRSRLASTEPLATTVASTVPNAARAPVWSRRTSLPSIVPKPRERNAQSRAAVDQHAVVRCRAAPAPSHPAPRRAHVRDPRAMPSARNPARWLSRPLVPLRQDCQDLPPQLGRAPFPAPQNSTRRGGAGKAPRPRSSQLVLISASDRLDEREFRPSRSPPRLGRDRDGERPTAREGFLCADDGDIDANASTSSGCAPTEATHPRPVARLRSDQGLRSREGIGAHPLAPSHARWRTMSSEGWASIAPARADRAIGCPARPGPRVPRPAAPEPSAEISTVRAGDDVDRRQPRRAMLEAAASSASSAPPE